MRNWSIFGSGRDPLTRKIAILAVLSLLAASCTKGGKVDVPFGVWKELRAALRSSPDHLPATAERLVKSKDPEAIYRFVRDQIATYPSAAGGFGGYPEGQLRWGIRGTLRGGAGTPREKAELLADMYRRAGLEAKVVQGKPNLDEAAIKRMLFRLIPREFAPKMEKKRLAELLRLMGVKGDPKKLQLIDRDGADSKAIAAQVARVLPSELKAPDFDWSSFKRMPLVRVTVKGEEKFANPLVPHGKFGETFTEGKPAAISSPIAAPTVTAQLEVVTTESLTQRVVVAEGKWSVEDLVGRQIIANFAPVEDVETLASTALKDLHTFMPVLAVRGADVSAKEAKRLLFSGKPITSAGALLEVNEKGEVVVGGQALGSGEVDRNLVARVKTLSIKARSSTFPSVEVRARALDSQGKSVEGLGPGAFRLLEEGKPMAPSMSANTSGPARVLMVLDGSGSIPPEFRGQSAAPLVRNLADRLVAADPRTQMRIVGVFEGLSDHGEWTSDPTQLEQQIGKTAYLGSALWKAVSDAKKLAATVIVFITDGENTDQPEPGQKEKISSGAPILSLGVGPVKRETLDELARLSGGQALSVGQTEEAIAAILKFAEAHRDASYVFKYQAPAEGPSERKVELSTIADAKGETTYTVPPPDLRVAPPSVAGIYLTLRMGAEEVTRRLAPRASDPKLGPELAKQLEEVHGAMLGSTTISFEGAAPPLSVWLDDFLRAKLSLEPLLAAVKSGDNEKIVKAYESGYLWIPPALLPLHPPLQPGADASSLTYETGPRVVIYARVPVLDHGLIRRSDVLPFTRWATASDDPSSGFKLTLERSARLAAVEKALFKTSTSSVLSDKKLIGIKADTPASEALASLPEVVRKQWEGPLRTFRRYHIAIPESGDQLAFWAVDQNGSLLGLLQDGTGGGEVDEINQTFDRADRALSGAALAGTVFDWGTPVGVWISLERAKLKALRKATIAIATLEAPEKNPLKEAAEGVACDLIKTGISSAAGAAGISLRAVEILDGTVDLAGGTLIKCPP